MKDKIKEIIKEFSNPRPQTLDDAADRIYALFQEQKTSISTKVKHSTSEEKCCPECNSKSIYTAHVELFHDCNNCGHDWTEQV